MASQAATIDLNADVGEGGAVDAALFAAGISSANVACGAHAGDAETMAAACALAARHGVALGAHPGHADRPGFGRRELPLARDDAEALLHAQFRMLSQAAERAGLAVRHVKPHGALYHQANREPWLAEMLVGLARTDFPGAAVFGPPAGALRDAALAAAATFVPEGFIDRGYRADGTLIPRGEPGAVLHDESEVVAQALALARSGRVRTLCVHGDGPDALRLLVAARAALLAGGFRIAAPTA
jgi:5-oxoprolinase (ATP-hydrolysing) subunit A